MSTNKMLIDASHDEETRVVVLKQGRVQEFDFEAAARKLLKGSIYLAKVTRVEPSLQAAFIDFGGNRHGFLAFNEIHPDYYQIPVADREALLAEQAEQRARMDAEEDAEAETVSASVDRDDDDDDTESEVIEIDDILDDDTDGDDDVVDADDETSHDDETEQQAAAQPEFEAPAAVALPELDSSVVEVAEAAAIDVTDLLPEEPTETDDAEADSSETGSTSVALNVAADDAQHSEPVDASSEDNDETDDDDAPASSSRPQRNGRGRSSASHAARSPRRRARQYKIQEVIKRRQIVLVQVVKEERGNKGAALTTYLSLAGRYTVLMPNTARGGGISRKITNAQDRKRLKSVVQDLDVPEGMGLIVRTAGAARTKQEIKRDFEYLLRLWETVRDLTLRSKAPALVYEEGNLIKRAIRDLYSKEIDEVVVSGQEAHRSAKDFMRMLMPSHAKNVVRHDEPISLFKRYGIENQLNALFSPIVTLPSGGYLVINQTEALVAIDINSGRSTREFSIEETAYKTNLEAAEEISRQLKLRDLAGLVVIDFIDMDEKRNNRGVERKLKDALKFDRARIQVGRISHFGLLEMSRQRLRTGMLEGSTSQCEHCQGTGIIRSVESIALSVLRGIEDAVEPNGPDLTVKTAPHVAFYLLNQKRHFLSELEERCDISIEVVGSSTEQGANYKIETATGEQAPRPSARRAKPPAISVDHGFIEADEEDTSASTVEQIEEDDDGDTDRNGRRRRRRRGGRRDENKAASSATADDETSSDDDEENGDGEPRGRRRGRRGGQRNRGRGRHGTPAFEAPSEYDLDPSEFEEFLGVSAEIYVAQAKTVASAAAAARRKMVNGQRGHDESEGPRRDRGGERGRSDRAGQARTIASAGSALETPDIDTANGPLNGHTDAATESRPRRSRRRRGAHRETESTIAAETTVETIEIVEEAPPEAPAMPMEAEVASPPAAVAAEASQAEPSEVQEASPVEVAEAAPVMAKAEVDDADVETEEKAPRSHWGEQVASEPVVHRVTVSTNGNESEEQKDSAASPPPENAQRKGWWQRNFG